MRTSTTTGTAGLVAGAVLSLAAAGMVLAPAADSAQPSTPSCVNVACTASFAFTGAEQDWTVPTDVSEITVTVAAGSGGAGTQASGGAGGEVTATVPVTAGHSLALVVGQAGADKAFRDAGLADPAYGGGGVGGWFDMSMDMPNSFEQNGSGGGGSFAWDVSGNPVLLIAAGGGGGGSWAGAGGGAGGAGTDGANGAAPPSCAGGFGFGATTSHAGAGSSDNDTGYPSDYLGFPGSGPATSPTAFGDGGSGNDRAAGGGGGGGVYGGGGGGGTGVPTMCSYDASGGGGSGYLGPQATAVSTQANVGDGSIQISYRLDVATSTTLTISPSGSAPAGSAVTLTATVSPAPATGGTVTFLDGTQSIETTPVSSGTAHVVTAALTLGAHQISAVYSGATGSAASTSTAVTYPIVAATTPGAPPSAPVSHAQLHLTSDHLQAGSKGRAHASGFQPGETVVAALHSAPIALGSYPARADGSVTFAFTVPADLSPGQHTLTVTGHTSGRTATATLTVTARPPAAATLANTGSPTTALLALAAALVVLGSALLALTRRGIPEVRTVDQRG
jgi:hypothetical protein